MKNRSYLTEHIHYGSIDTIIDKEKNFDKE